MSTKVFVWKSYGENMIYVMDSIDKYKTLLTEIIDCLDNWGLEEHIVKVNAYLDKGISEIRYTQAINFLLEKIHVGSHEMFEEGTSFYNAK